MQYIYSIYNTKWTNKQKDKVYSIFHEVELLRVAS